MAIADNISDLIGNTPLVRLRRASEETGATIVGKLESFNPAGSVKDRIGLSMIDAAEKAGVITPGKTTLIEPTSGNTGIALAMVAAARGYHLVLTMPETMSVERRSLLKAYGAALVLTPGRAGDEGGHRQGRASCSPRRRTRSCRSSSRTPPTRRSTVRRRRRRSGGTPTARSTSSSPRSARAARSRVSARSSRRASRASWPSPSSPTRRPSSPAGEPGPHKIQGTGAGFVPKVLNTEIYDEIVRVPNEAAFETARSARLRGRHPRRHLRRGERVGGHRGRPSSREQGQADRHHPLRHGRALPLDAAVHGARRGDGQPVGTVVRAALSAPRLRGCWPTG